MNLKQLKPRRALNKAYLKLKTNRNMNINKVQNQKIIIRSIAIPLLLLAGILLRDYGEQFRWSYMNLAPILFLTFSIWKDMPKMSDRIKMLIFSAVIAGLSQIIGELFKFEQALPKLLPALAGGLLIIPLLFVKPLFKYSRSEGE